MIHLSGGFAAGFSAPTMAAIQEEFDLDDDTKNWFGKNFSKRRNKLNLPRRILFFKIKASILVVGQIIGCITGGYVSDLWGRRAVLVSFFSLSFIGWSIVAFSAWHPDREMAIILIFTGRFLHGLADSLGVSPAISLVSEVTTVKLRGMFMNSASIAASAGIPMAYLVGSFYSWHLTALVGAFFPFVGFVLLLAFVRHESPSFLWTKGRKKQSLEALQWYRAGYSDSYVASEFELYEDSNNNEDKIIEESKTQNAFAKEETIKPFVIVMTLLGLVPLTGIMSVTFFAMELLQGLGFADSTLVVAVSAGTLRAVGCTISGVIVVFKGRRFVLLASCFGAIVCIELATLAMIVKENIQDKYACDMILIAAIPTYMFFLGVGMTPVPWILLGEWFVPETRSKAGGIASAAFFLSALFSLQVRDTRDS